MAELTVPLIVPPWKELSESSDATERFGMNSSSTAARVSAQTCTNKGFVKIAGIGLGIPCSIHLSYRGRKLRKPYPLRVYSHFGPVFKLLNFA